MRQLETVSGDCQPVEEGPFIWPLRRQLDSLFRPPERSSERGFHVKITKDNKIPALSHRVELTVVNLWGYLEGAKFEKGLPGFILGGFSFVVLMCLLLLLPQCLTRGSSASGRESLA